MLRSTLNNVVKALIFFGIVPTKELECKSRVFSDVKKLIESGIEPVNEFKCSLREVKDVRALIEVGIVPLKKFVLRSKVSRILIEPNMASDMVPDKTFENNSR